MWQLGLLEALFLRSDFPEAVRVADRYMQRLETFGETPQLVFAPLFLFDDARPAVRVSQR